MKSDSPDHKKKKLKDEYNIVMDMETERRVNTMCNMSEAVLERGIERGIGLGIEQGRMDEVYSSVQEGDYGIERGAKKLNMSVIEFEKKMKEAGYKIPEYAE